MLNTKHFWSSMLDSPSDFSHLYGPYMSTKHPQKAGTMKLKQKLAEIFEHSLERGTLQDDPYLSSFYFFQDGYRSRCCFLQKSRGLVHREGLADKLPRILWAQRLGP